MTVHVIEPGLVARTGHFFDYSLGIASLLRAQGRGVVAHGQEDAAADVRAAFAAAGIAFEASLPSRLQRSSASGVDDLSWADRLHSCLAALAAASTAGAGDRWLFPTLQPRAFAVVSTLAASPPVVGLVHMPPDFESRLGAGLWRRAAASMKRAGRDCRLLAIDPLVAEMTQLHSAGLAVAAVPIPHGRWTRRQPAATIRSVGFFGHQRHERGLAMLGPLVGALRSRGLQVLMHDSRGRVGAPAGTTGLEIVHGFVADFSELVARCDLVVCPMERERYRYRISGVATHALASGVPVVMPAGTLTEYRWRDSGAVQAYHEDTLEDVLASIDQVLAQQAAFAQAAQGAAQDWERQHGLDRFVAAALPPS